MGCPTPVVRCDPAVDPAAPVIVLIDPANQSASHYQLDGTPWPGDPATLVDCDTSASFDYCATVTALPDRPANVTAAARLIVGDDGNCYAETNPCSVVGPNGQTGQQSGAFIDACTVLAMPADGDPESGFPASGYPEWWRQPFLNGVTGSEQWVVQADTNGVMSWHQST